MAADAQATAAFYTSARGAVTARLLRERLATLWPRLAGESILGIGHTAPYLRLWRDHARRCIALTPAQMGTARWPAAGCTRPHGLAIDRAGRRLFLGCSNAVMVVMNADNGRVVATAALQVGGRLMAVDLDNKITRLDPAGARHAAQGGLNWRLGEAVSPQDKTRIAQAMAQALVAALVGRPIPADVASLFVTDPISDLGAIDAVMVSGGVAEYVYGREKRDFGDLGWRLGRAFRKLLDEGALPWPLAPPGECIRATALGASEHSVQISGQTIHISDHAALLPRRNLRVIQPDFIFGETVEAGALVAAIGEHRAFLGVDEPANDFALAFRWRGAPDYARLRAFAEGIVAGMADRIAVGAPLYLMLEGDAAQSLGAILREDLGLRNDVLVIDAIALRDFDFVDIGRVRLPSNTVPVTIKSLLFGFTGK